MVLLVSACIISPLLLLFSVHWAMAPLCAVTFALILRLDWSLADRLALPPLGILLFVPALGAVIGIPLFVGSLETKYIPVYLLLQVVFIVGSVLVALGYRLARGPVSSSWCPPATEQIYDSIGTPLHLAGWALCFFDLARVIVGWRTGSLDRGYAGEIVLEQRIGAWTIAGIFGRFNNLWFFLLPLLWRQTSSLGRIVLSGVITIYAVIAFASGSRGLMLYPIVITSMGSFFFVDRPRFRPERWLPILVVLFASYLYLMDVYRNTEAFLDSRLSDIGARLAATKAISTAAQNRGDFGFTTGRALIGASDDVIFDATPDEVPFAGADDILPAIAWTWVPHTLAPDKPPLWDANEVVVSYTNNRQERSFSSITLGADLFRRFGWLGFVIGLFVFGAVYGLAIRILIYVFTRKNVFLGVLLLALLVSGLQASYSATVLQTWWIWAYDIPKHVIPLIALAFLLGGKSRGGIADMQRPVAEQKNARISSHA